MAFRSKCVDGPLNEWVKDRIVGRNRPEMVYSSSGSEHSATASQIGSSSSSSHSLSYLVNCFDENEDKEEKEDKINGDECIMKDHNNDSDTDADTDIDTDRVEAKNQEIISTLRNLNHDKFRNILLSNVVRCYNVFRSVNPNKQIINRNVMLFLQKHGYNAAVCKTKWDTCGGLASGNHEFLDVIRPDGLRYYIDLNFAGEFEIARQTNHFQLLARHLPSIFVGKSDDLKLIVKSMCDEIRRSLKSRGLVLPPWRKNRFMQNMWFGPYRRTVNYTPAKEKTATVGVKCSVIGFNVVDGAPLVSAATRTR